MKSVAMIHDDTAIKRSLRHQPKMNHCQSGKLNLEISERSQSSLQTTTLLLHVNHHVAHFISLSPPTFLLSLSRCRRSVCGFYKCFSGAARSRAHFSLNLSQLLVSLRRTIYLTIKSSGGFEECCHKLMRINLPHGLEKELTSMIVECASQERTYEKFYGMVGERFCKLNRMWDDLFEDGFVHYYETAHRVETPRLRIISQFFAHLLATDAIGWHVWSVKVPAQLCADLLEQCSHDARCLTAVCYIVGHWRISKSARLGFP